MLSVATTKSIHFDIEGLGALWSDGKSQPVCNSENALQSLRVEYMALVVATERAQSLYVKRMARASPQSVRECYKSPVNA